MSGGSLNYICYRISEELEEQMEDEVMNELVADFVRVAHDLEWWKSADYGEEDYRKTVKEFKDKWFNNYSETHQRLINQAKEKAIEEIKRI